MRDAHGSNLRRVDSVQIFNFISSTKFIKKCSLFKKTKFLEEFRVEFTPPHTVLNWSLKFTNHRDEFEKQSVFSIKYCFSNLSPYTCSSKSHEIDAQGDLFNPVFTTMGSYKYEPVFLSSSYTIHQGEVWRVPFSPACDQLLSENDFSISLQVLRPQWASRLLQEISFHGPQYQNTWSEMSKLSSSNTYYTSIRAVIVSSSSNYTRT